jgi:hypothetical protein
MFAALNSLVSPAPGLSPSRAIKSLIPVTFPRRGTNYQLDMTCVPSSQAYEWAGISSGKSFLERFLFVLAPKAIKSHRWRERSFRLPQSDLALG